MSVYFGTDGIRGIVNKDLSSSLSFMVGNSIAKQKPKTKILIGRDTRISGSFIVTSLSSGALQAGADVVDVGIIPTPAIAFLTKKLGYDFGVVISASHNPPEYNGIKIFNNLGLKLTEMEESSIEKNFPNNTIKDSMSVGSYSTYYKLKDHYISHLINSCKIRLTNLKVVLDCGNGASYDIAPKVFKKLGAKVIPINCKNDGKNINRNCGALNVEGLVEKVKMTNADVGFAFDGDADRIIAVDENGKILNGDEILCIIAKDLKKQNKLNQNTIVGTSMTNSGIVAYLQRENISLIRTDVGDKYVIEAMEKNNLNLGGEQSGHIIIKDSISTGDGVLTALYLCQCIVKNKKPLSKLCDAKSYPQISENVEVEDKLRVINNEYLKDEINKISNIFKDDGRILVRASGTEPKIRIMAEHKDINVARYYLNEVIKIIKKSQV